MKLDTKINRIVGKHWADVDKNGKIDPYVMCLKIKRATFNALVNELMDINGKINLGDIESALDVEDAFEIECLCL